MPKVTLQWSCQVDTEKPHFDDLTGYKTFIGNLSAWGVEHRMLFHVDVANKMLRIAPVGRLHDSIQMPVGPDGYFVGELPALSARIEGKLAQYDTQLLIQLGKVTVSGASTLEITITGELLSPLP